MKKNEKTRGKLHFFIFLKIFAPLEAKMMKNEKNMKKNEKKWKTRGKLQFSFFGKLQFSSVFFHFFFICFSFFLSFSMIFHHFSSIPPLEAKMIKNDKTNDKKMKKPRKIAIFNCSEIFAPLEAKMMKNEKKM